jgi:hypothetical protein
VAQVEAVSYATLDDNISDHPKVIAVGNAAELVFMRSIVYANRVRTDGVIPAAVVPFLCRGEDQAAVERALVQGGLWERNGSGYVIHDFLDHNLSRAAILARHLHMKNIGRKGGSRGRSKR